MKIAFNNDYHATGFAALFMIVANMLLIFPNLVVNILMWVVAGALAGWLVGLLPLGTWIVDGLSLIHVGVRCADIYKLGAVLGCARCFLK